MSAVARELELSLREVGYSEQRWYPIGRGQSHGFAVTTRLEHLEADLHHAPHERWSSLYVDAADLRWLMQARTPTLPHAGRYRVFLLAYTDLPIERSSNGPTWNEETIMDWPGAPHASSADEAGAPAFASNRYRLGIYEYEYEYMGEDVDHRGRWLPHDAKAESERAPPLASRLKAHGFTPRLVDPF